MANSCVSFHLFYLLSTCLMLGAHEFSIKAFKHSNFTGLAWASYSNLGCTNLPRDKWEHVNSIRTDTCFIAYYGPGCKLSFSEKYLPGSISLTHNQLGRYAIIKSFHICNDEEAGNQLNVDIARYYKAGSDVTFDVLESYKNVCSCVKFPEYVQTLPYWSIDNHHNDLLAYYAPDCLETKWNSTFIKAGHNWDSRNMQEHQKTDNVTQKTYKIQSFGPDPNSIYFQVSCNSSHDIITKGPKVLESTSQSANPSPDIFQSERLLNAMRKLWSYSHRQDQVSDWTCMSCFDN